MNRICTRCFGLKRSQEAPQARTCICCNNELLDKDEDDHPCRACRWASCLILNNTNDRVEAIKTGIQPSQHTPAEGQLEETYFARRSDAGNKEDMTQFGIGALEGDTPTATQQRMDYRSQAVQQRLIRRATEADKEDSDSDDEGEEQEQEQGSSTTRKKRRRGGDKLRMKNKSRRSG